MTDHDGIIQTWRTSSRSSGGNGNCVEVGADPSIIAVRDTKDRDGGALVFDRTDWARFTQAL